MITKREQQKLVDFVTRLNFRMNTLECLSAQEEVLWVMAKFILSSLNKDRRARLHEDKNRFCD